MSSRAAPRPCDGLTAQKLADDGIFLYENGADAVLYFGTRVDPGLVQAVLGMPFPSLKPRSLQASSPSGLLEVCRTCKTSFKYDGKKSSCVGNTTSLMANYL